MAQDTAEWRWPGGRPLVDPQERPGQLDDAAGAPALRVAADGGAAHLAPQAHLPVVRDRPEELPAQHALDLAGSDAVVRRDDVEHEADAGGRVRELLQGLQPDE